MPDTTENRAYLTKAQLETAKLADSKEDNYGISNLRVTETETVVTDGHVLLVAKHRQPIAGLKPFSLSRADALTLAKAATTKSSRYESGPYAKVAKVEIDIEATQANGHVRAIGSSVVEVVKVESSYPDWTRVIPTDAPDFTIGVDAKLLATLLLQVAQFADERSHAVKIHLRTQRNKWGEYRHSPIEIEAGTEGGEQVRALIGPIRI